MTSTVWKTKLIQLIDGDGVDMKTGATTDLNKDGKIDDADATSTAPTTLVADAHKPGLFVHPFTVCNERRRLVTDYKGDATNEYLAYYRFGVDGVFTDFTDTALAARRAYLKVVGR